MQWRFIPFQHYDPYVKTALNDVAISSVQGTREPIIWLAGWEQECITVGQDQCVTDTVNEAAAEKQDICIARRQDEGRAMYLTEYGQVTWNVVLPEGEDWGDDQFNAVYERMCNTVVDALDRLDIDAAYRSDHAVTVDGRKISGAVMRRSHGVIHVSGTLLHKMDPEMVLTLLVPGKDATLESVKWLQDRVATVDKEVEAPFDDTVDALRAAFLTDREYEEVAWEEQERTAAEQLADKYRSEAWIYRNSN